MPEEQPADASRARARAAARPTSPRVEVHLDPAATSTSMSRPPRTGIAAILERLEELERATQAMPERVDRRFKELGRALAGGLGKLQGRVSAAVSADLDGRLAALREEVSTLTEDVRSVREQATRQVEALQEGFAEIARMAQAVEAMSRRRGFRQLVESERRLLEEQTELVQALQWARQAVSGNLEGINRRLEALQAQIHDLRGARSTTG